MECESDNQYLPIEQLQSVWGFPKIKGYPKMDGFYMFLLENPVEIDDMGIAPFQETSRNVERHQGWAPRAKDKTGEIKAPGRINPG